MTGEYEFREPPSHLEIHMPDSGMLVRVKADGTLEYGPNYSPDAAAAALWEAVAGHFNDKLEQQFTAGFAMGYRTGKGEFDG